MFVAQQAKIGKKSLISNLVFERLFHKFFALILRILEPLCVCATITNFSKVFTWMEPKLAFVLVEVLDRVKSLTKKIFLH